jgi:hypothetical protein
VAHSEFVGSRPDSSSFARSTSPDARGGSGPGSPKLARTCKSEDRIDGPLYAVEGWHPDLGRVVVIEGSAEAVLVSEVPLPEV